nr:L-lactate permease [Glycomyces sp. L485]
MLAALPILTVLLLMLAASWSAARTGTVVAAGTMALAVAAFGFGNGTDRFGIPAGIAGILAEAGFVALTVIAIIGPALGIHHLQQRTGATDRLRAGLARLTPDPRVSGLLIAWFFTLFLEGAAGFGTPVALAAPFLVAAGFRPVAAVTAAMVGHAAAVSFGAVGTPVMAQVSLTELSGPELAWATAPYHLVLGILLALMVAFIIGRAADAGRPPWGWAAAAALLFFVPYGLIARFVGPELPSLGGALIGMAAFTALVAVVRRVRHGSPTAPDAEPDPPMGLLRAGAPYLALVALVLVTRLIPPVRTALYDVEWQWRLFSEFTGELRPLYHPALLLTAAFIIGAVAQRATLPQTRDAFTVATRQLGVVLIALVGMVAIAFTMSRSGMTGRLAESAAATGAWWPLLAPSVGALGTFVTGSATASNVLFTEFQESTAQAAGLPVAPLLGAQGFGAAVGNIICPHNIVAAAATVGLSGREGNVLRLTLPVAAAYTALGGALALWFVG